MRLTWLFGHGNAPRAPVLVALLVLLNALLLRVVDPDALVRLRDLAFDSYQRIKPRTVPDDLPVSNADIDEAALEACGQWPWPRDLVARMVDRLREEGAAVIAFDVVFAAAIGLAFKQAADFATLELDLITIKGKTEPAWAFALLGDATVAQIEAYRALLEHQSAFLKLYRAGNFAGALELIDELNGKAGALGWKQGYYDMIRERIKELIAEPPPEWNGAYVAKEK